MRWILLIVLIAGCRGGKLVDSPQCESKPEICNGLDDDCDGVVDNFSLTSVHCSTACGQGLEVCKNGKMLECDAKQPHPEICDGIDNDCDGIVDNAEKLAVEFCYNGAPADLTHPGAPCAPGILRCEFARKVCRGQVTPQPETCNGLDDNCDGRIDEGVLKKSELDIVIVIDNSCSMGPVIEKVKSVAVTFKNKYANRTDLRWALVAAPNKDYSRGIAPTLEVDFTDPGQFSATMALQDDTGSGYEATIDAIDMLISYNNPLRLTWKPGAKKSIVIFSDEEPQSYASTETYQTIGWKVANKPNDPLADIRVFTNLDSYVSYSMWNQVAPGGVYNIEDPESVMAQNLENIIAKNSCTP